MPVWDPSSFALTAAEAGLDALAASTAPIVVTVAKGPDGAALDPAAAALDKATGGQATRALKGAKGGLGEVVTLLAPAGMAAPAALLVGRGDAALDAPKLRAIGGAAAAALVGRALGGQAGVTAEFRVDGLTAAGMTTAELAAEIGLGAALRAYRFEKRRSAPEAAGLTGLRLAPASDAALAPRRALLEGAALCRDLVNEPANHLDTNAFMDAVRGLAADGVEVEILDEAAMAALGMHALLAVGRGSRKPSYMATMRWKGAADKAAPPVCLVGKGVVFDTGGISLKPPAGMEEMTMDMGGAAVVVGAMRALARRKAAVNVVGLIGVVENMPDGDAQRPGDVVTSASGKTIEVINTDAEGRLVLCDVLWRAQEVEKPRWIVDLATLTGAMIIALGHENAGYFSNDDALAAALEKAAAAEGEGLWRLPLGEAYDKKLKSRIADMKNVGGRDAGSITAAQFLQRFIKPGQAWAHIDIAGVALVKEPGPTWPKGATGWGVATLTRLVEESFAAG